MGVNEKKKRKAIERERKLDKTLYEVHEWARMRIATLTHSGNKKINALDEKCIREEFKEWLDPDLEDHDVFSMEYIGEGSDYD